MGRKKDILKKIFYEIPLSMVGYEKTKIHISRAFVELVVTYMVVKPAL